ncbi:hypothetical protein [Phaeobacter sp. NW0010-22]|uniref:COG3904 family protein n=1 Tax=Phaeobacter sp. NW0010-22 TaxID=3135907 RepID=UPI00310AD5A4
MQSDPASLARVFWLWLVVPRVAIYAALTAVGAVLTLPLIPLYILMVCDIAFFFWQAMRFQRAADAYVSGLGSMIPVWGGYLALLLAASLMSAQWWGLGLAAYAPPEAELFTDRMDREHAATYALTVSEDGETMLLSGDITFGLTKRVTDLIAANPNLQSVSLTSEGGHIYEARGVARVILSQKLNTQAVDTCNSACTLVFVAGTKRSLAPGASLGFHQYALNFATALPHLDLQEEQDKDRAFFRDQGVSPQFLTRMFDTPSAQLWSPTRAEATTAGLITP